MNFLLLSSGPSKGQLYTLKRTTFGIQKSPFYIANVLLLQVKCTPFGVQNDHSCIVKRPQLHRNSTRFTLQCTVFMHYVITHLQSQ